MAAGNFPSCRAFLKQPGIEGGKDDDPRDPGGRTNEGIEQREFSAWLKLQKQPDADVWDASESALTTVYRVNYWNPFCEFIPKGVDLVFFDIHVNQGYHWAVVFLQQALGIPADGHYGVVTQAHVQDIVDSASAGSDVPTAREVIESMTAQRIHRYRGLAEFNVYGKGWLNRAAACQKAALEMLNAAQPGPSA